MMRKLPPDSEVAALSLCGLKYREIAERYGVSLQQVSKAMDRWRGREGHQTFIKAVHDDTRFVAAGKQPCDHRDTGDGFGFGSPVDAFRVSHISLDDCADLLREWGAA